MRLLMWIITITCALAGLGLRVDGGFAGAGTVARGLLFIAILSCPFLWARPTGLVPQELAVSGRHRFMLVLALVFAAPLFLPWQLWL